MVHTKKNIGLIGFDRSVAKGLEQGGLNIVSHIYSNEKQKKKEHETKACFMNFHDWKSYNFSEETAECAPIKIVTDAKKTVWQEFIRCTDRWPWSSALVHNWSDYNHLFKIACDQAYSWLRQYEIGCLIYSNVPHQGMALAQFAVARELGIKTLIFTQSGHKGRSWCVHHWEKIGNFDITHPKNSKGFKISITAPNAPPFYMASVKSKRANKIRNMLKIVRARGLVTLGLTGLNSKDRREGFQINTKRWQEAVEDKRYFKSTHAFFNDVLVEEEYVYFPLHYQPEMTTDVLGGDFADQVLALETLREIIPKDITIYVKENPKQTGRLRSDSFFKRIQKIHNIKFISPEIPSFDLIKNSIAVATITGTAGWEALRMEKPVIVFGSIFWKNFAGAFHIDKNPNWDDIKAFKYNENKLQNCANLASQFAHEVICDSAYVVQLESFNEQDNTKKLAKIIKQHL